MPRGANGVCPVALDVHVTMPDDGIVKRRVVPFRLFVAIMILGLVATTVLWAQSNRGRTVYIHTVRLHSVPFYTDTGAEWDSVFGGPDVYLTINDYLNRLLLKTPKIQDARVSDLPVTWRLERPVPIHPGDDLYFMRIWDADLTEPELMDQTTYFTHEELANGPEATIRTWKRHAITLVVSLSPRPEAER
jgi:hypothetical protein